MNYEKAYKDALERARVAYKDEDRHLKATLERIFPELQESEDERIRKELIEHFRWNAQILNNFDNRDVITWLEKQQKKAVYTDNDRIMVSSLIRDVDQITYINEEGKNKRLEWLNSLKQRFGGEE